VSDAVVAAFNLPTEVIESGAATWSTQPNSEPGGEPVPTLIVRVTVEAPDDIDRRSLDAIVDSVKPAHMPHRVEVITRTTAASPAAAVAAAPPVPAEAPVAPAAPAAPADEAPSAPAGDGEPISTADDDQTSVISITDVDETPPSSGDGEQPSDS
jgi:hypothetical protein